MNIVITKYNPKNRNKEGAYLLDEWTDVSDIGKYKDLQSYAEYKSWEKKYWDTIKSILDDLQINELEISYFSTGTETQNQTQTILKESHVLDEPDLMKSFQKLHATYNFSYKRLFHIFGISLFRINKKYRIGKYFQFRSHRKYRVTLEEAEQLFYLSMRGATGVQLSGKNGILIHCGYEFYAYVEADVKLHWKTIPGIYVEDCIPFEYEDEEDEEKQWIYCSFYIKKSCPD